MSNELAHNFANKCFTPLEIYCFKEVFKSLCDEQSGIKYWTEDSLSKYLEIPDAIGAKAVLYQMVTFLGAFPLPSQAPCIVTRENLLKVVTLMTARYEKVLKRKQDRLRLFYGSLAVMDRRASDVLERKPDPAKEQTRKDPLEDSIKSVAGFAIDEPLNDDYEEPEGDDELALALLDSMDATAVLGLGDAPNTQHSIIPADNFLKLIQLLLLIAPLGPQQNLATYADLITNDALPDLRQTSECILSAFGVEDSPGITFRTFKSVVSASLPHMFDGLNALFEHFLFEKDLNLSKPRSSSPSATLPPTPSLPTYLQPTSTDLLDPLTTRHLSFLLSPSIFTTLHPLYRASTAGSSLTSLATTVFPWPGPTLLLLSGHLLPPPTSSRERTFAASLPPPRFPASAAPATRVLYGAYIPTQWHATHRAPFGTPATRLFQLAPSHDAFPASTLATDYATFASAPHARHPGIGFGVPLAATAGPVPLGPVSLFLDAGLDYAVFTHTAPPPGAPRASSGGSFLPSRSPHRRKRDWQDRFEVEHLEVWGIGGAAEEGRRRRALEFEETEARLRRDGKNALGVSGYEADREILKMAGLVGHGEGGGSMGGYGV